MEIIEVKCPKCRTTKIIKYGMNKNGEQRYCCRNTECNAKTFKLEYNNKGCDPEIEQKIMAVAANGNGIQHISRVLNVSPYKVMNTLKKQKF